MGTAGDALAQSSERIARALERTLDSDTGRWILSGSHRDAACEMPLAGVLDGELVNAIIDRTFVDAEGTRWIIDYKSGYHEGADVEGFLGEEAQRYASQLDTYRRLFESLGESPVRTALYLPHHDRLEIVGD